MARHLATVGLLGGAFCALWSVGETLAGWYRQMSRNLWTAILCVVTATATDAWASSWSSVRDNLPIADLQLMTDEELSDAAAGVCTHGAFHQSVGEYIPDATKYLTTIRRVVRSKHNCVEPEWMGYYLGAILAGVGDIHRAVPRMGM
jgi:hypothetical protein